MAARLGNVFYWLGWAIAIPAGLFAAYMFYVWYVQNLPPEHQWGQEVLAMKLAAISVGSWLIGRAARYVLAGR